jgi:hypothetical protein
MYNVNYEIHTNWGGLGGGHTTPAPLICRHRRGRTDTTRPVDHLSDPQAAEIARDGTECGCPLRGAGRGQEHEARDESGVRGKKMSIRRVVAVR